MWNGFHLGLKLPQEVAVGYAVLVLLANVWKYLSGNQTSMRFLCIPTALEEYLALPKKKLIMIDLRRKN